MIKYKTMAINKKMAATFKPNSQDSINNLNNFSRVAQDATYVAPKLLPIRLNK